MSNKPFFESCPKCKSRSIQAIESGYVCNECQTLFDKDEAIETSPVLPVLPEDNDQTMILIRDRMIYKGKD